MIRNYNILRFHTDQNKLYSNREYIGTKLGKILAEQRSIPPFQIIRPTLTNSPITSFNLINQADGTSTSYLTEALATCLSVQESANDSNYAETGLTPHDIPISSQSSAWGFSITASISSLRHAVVTAYCNDFDNIPSKFTARILDSKGGTQLLESTEVKKVPPFKTNFKVYFDFGQVYDNTTPYNLYLEVKADGVWKPVGNDALYSGETVSYRNDAGANYDTTGYPDTDQDPLIATDGSAYVETYEYGGNFDVIVNDGSDIGVYIPTGVYSIEMSDGRYTWYSEPFKVVDYINDFLKIQYWHNEPFPLPLGNMRYFDGYKNQLLLDAKIRQPEYEEEENVEERLGIELPISRTSKKVMKFMFYATEYMLDAIRLIWLHHNITIETDCELYTVDEFNISNVEWDREGLFGEVTVEFTTQTVVTTTGHNRSDNNYIEQEVLDLAFPTLTECLDCIEYDYQTEDIVLASLEGSYSPSPNYAKYVIVNNDLGAGELLLKYWDGSSFSTVALDDGQVVYHLPTDTYYFRKAVSGDPAKYKELLTTTVLDSVTNLGGNSRRIDGTTFKHALIQVEYEQPGGTLTKTPVYDGQELNENGIVVDQPSVSQFRVYAFGKDCEFTVSAWIANV